MPPRHTRSNWDGNGTKAEATGLRRSDSLALEGAEARNSSIEPAHQFSQSQDHIGVGPDPVRWAHEYVQRTERVLLKPKRLTDAALDTVALSSPCGVLARDKHSKAGRSSVTTLEIERVSRDALSRTFLEKVLEHRTLPEAQLGAESIPCRLGSPVHAPQWPKDRLAYDPARAARATPHAHLGFGYGPETRGAARAASSTVGKYASSPS